jgi:hypothetical protein
MQKILPELYGERHAEVAADIERKENQKASPVGFPPEPQIRKARVFTREPLHPNMPEAAPGFGPGNEL